MADPPDPAARIEALERRVAALEAQLAQPPASRRPHSMFGPGPEPQAGAGPAQAGGAAPGSPVPEAPRPAVPLQRARRKRRPGLRWAEASSEDVLGKVGIGLLLVGLLFLLNYAIDQGLLTPAVRVAGAGATGLALLGLGLFLRERRALLGRLLQGGGIAALYGTLWTATVLYPLLPTAVAFAGLAVVSAGALVLATRQQDAALAVVGTLGGLLVPLLIRSEPGPVEALMGYLVLIVAGAGVVFARRGWQALLGSLFVGGWALLFAGWWSGGFAEGEASGTARLAFAGGVLVVFAVTGLVPLWRQTRAEPRPLDFAAWPRLLQPFTASVALAPLVTLFAFDGLTAWPDWVAVPVGVAVAAGYGLVAHRLASADLRFRDRPAAFAAAVLAAAGVALWAAAEAFGIGDGDARPWAVAVAVGCSVVLVARREHDRELGHVGHAAALGSTTLLLGMLFYEAEPFGGASVPAPATLVRVLGAGAISALALGVVGFRSRRDTTARWVYVTAAHLVVILMIRLALKPLVASAALTSITWGVYGIALVVVGLRRRDDLLRGLGLGTVLATALKALVFDLAAIPGLWRVLLFMGLGALLLVVSYLVPSLLKGLPEDEAAPPEPPPIPPGPGAPGPPPPPPTPTA